MDRYLVNSQEIAPGVWFPASIREEHEQTASTHITTASEIKLHPEITPDAFDPLKALNLPNGTWLRRRDLAGKTLNFRIRDGQAVPLADEELGQQPKLPDEP